ncbi:MAG: adenylyltransferase/cytidyltransferase family protein, partial [Acidimicrobiia bacterium]|nr:adenylyltransferase/cytidyltransferase family protein [Acidimicrobiia bacterium]
MAGRTRRGAFPGSFNPLTLGHLAVVEAARDQCGLDVVDLVVSRVALAKESVERPRLDDRIAVLRAAAEARPWLGVVVTDHQLIADIATEYDVLVVGADKWAQILDPAFYGGSTVERDAALARLPEVVVAPRPPAVVPGDAAVLDVSHEASSTAVREGRREWMAPEAAEFDEA